MKKKIIISIALVILLSTVNSQQKITISKFNLQKISIENNVILKDKDLKEALAPIYNKNLIFLKNKEVEELLIQNSLIQSFTIKKKYPSTLKIKIFEKKPIAILINKKNKFYLNNKIDLFEFIELSDSKNLPIVFGNLRDFKIFYNNLKKINFPFNTIKKFTFHETNRWELLTINNKVINLPKRNYLRSLENFSIIKNKSEFKNYKVFDYRINNQLILK